ncbi:endoribonuclease L-PSP [Capronia coronata CBS 617.96]|uniref:Endoribonuclease L-PSP n=1 Tax=Capronia coronata CBS 617.96 TaxID=1182541 RepID=W9YSX5_9EURO|nr:endoribonuclease L-PSP [Capronia coronata CBS 617.96]EXJ85369.1 endoribonuclease L-PSP [Capronia coronata CBS 617.96]
MSSGLTPVLTKDACPPSGPYSQAIKAAGQIWVAGQIPADSTGQLVSGSIAQKTEQCCKNIKAIVEAAGSEMTKVVKVNIFLADMKFFAEMNGEYEKWFGHKPARSCVAVRELPKGVDVEIEAVAIQ